MFANSKLRQLSFVFITVLLALSTLLLITSLTLAKPTGTIIVNPGDSIQAAIDSAIPGDTIVINAGTYTESLTLSKAVSLTGVNSATVIIHAVGNQRVLTITTATLGQSVISGLTIANGLVTGTSTCPTSCGGGIFVMAGSFPIIRDTIITNNRAGYLGGGIYAAPPNLLTLINVNVISNSAACGGGAFVGGTLTPPARAILIGGRIENNYCTAVNCIGGGLLADLPTITDTLFIGNSAAGGGGGLVAYTTTLVGGRFENNWTTGLYGGGIELWGGLTLSGTQFISNSADLGGGGIAVDGGDSFIMGGYLARNRCVSPGCLGGGAFIARGLNLASTQFISNSAAGNGGGLAHYPFSGDPAGRVVNALFAGNSAFYGGTDLYLNSPGNVVILHSTIATPTLGSGSAIYVNAGTVGITNTIIASHSIGIQQSAGTVYENYNLFFGNETNTIGAASGGNSITGAPAFLNPLADDYHLTDTSAAIDAGVDAAVTSDFEGNGRPQINGFDIGYDELQSVKKCGLLAGNTYAFNPIPVQIKIDVLGALTCLQVQQFNVNHPAATPNLQSNKYWTITPSGTPSGFVVDLTLPHNGFTNPRACRYPGGLGGAGWDCTGTQTSTALTVTRQGVTQFSDWAAGNNVGPTAITLRNSAARTTEYAASTLIVVIAIILGLSAALRRMRS